MVAPEPVPQESLRSFGEFGESHVILFMQHENNKNGADDSKRKSSVECLSDVKSQFGCQTPPCDYVPWNKFTDKV